ncbi:MAG: ABC transporter permease [Dehalococcoidia bacterium]|nr:ABC transporter permease [Dehalococcoidia bacterium]MDP6782388.1 ABC transporter permease [Dehalococcoidia bacterium]
MGAIFWKEMTDYLGSRRFVVLLALISLSGVYAVFVAAQTIRSDVANAPTELVFLRLFTTGAGLLRPSFVTFVGFFGPFIGLALGFDAISGERSRRTLGRLLAQPVYRDAVINGKFLAGAATIGLVFLTIFLIITGMGMRLLGYPPGLQEMAFMGVFLVVSVLYITFWLGVAILASVFFERPVLSALVSVGLWLFFSMFILMVASSIADFAVADTSTLDQQISHDGIQQMALRFSPVHLFQEATVTLLSPTVTQVATMLLSPLGPYSQITPSPLSLSQTMLLVWPHLIALVGLTVVTFTIAYIRFMREEIRT